VGSPKLQRIRQCNDLQLPKHRNLGIRKHLDPPASIPTQHQHHPRVYNRIARRLRVQRHILVHVRVGHRRASVQRAGSDVSAIHSVVHADRLGDCYGVHNVPDAQVQIRACRWPRYPHRQLRRDAPASRHEQCDGGAHHCVDHLGDWVRGRADDCASNRADCGATCGVGACDGV